MPYINEEMQTRNNAPADLYGQIHSLDQQVDELILTIRARFSKDELEGVCNYTISRIIAGVMKPKDGWRYKWLNRAYGTFLSAAAEFYRRLVAPYEDKCIEKNGDIPEYEEFPRE
jgi:hypothetical protein